MKVKVQNIIVAIIGDSLMIALALAGSYFTYIPGIYNDGTLTPKAR